jgi:undecaprenyl-diphosphatase
VRHPPSLSPRALAIAGWTALIVCGAVFLAIAWNVTTRSALVAFDVRAAEWLHADARANAGTAGFFLVVTHLHSPVGIAVLGAIFGTVLWRLRERYWLLTLVSSVAGGLFVNFILKTAYERLRPRLDEPLLSLESYSFPSGHTAGAVLFYGVLAAFLVSRFFDWRARAACVAGACVMVALVAFSRIYLGAHFVSDVIAAACSSLVWLVLCLSAGHGLVRKTLRPYSVIAAVTIMLLVAGIVLIPDAWWSGFEDWVEDLDPLVAFLVFCGVYALSMLLLLPVWVFPVAAGAIFGLAWGLAAAALAVATASFIGLVVIRYVSPARLQRRARASRMFKAIEHEVARKPWRMVALLRLSPVIPCGLKSYFLGLTRIELGPYMAASLAGMAPDLALKVYLGAAGRGALGAGGALNWALLAGGLAALFFLSWIVGRRVRERLQI